MDRSNTGSGLPVLATGGGFVGAWASGLHYQSLRNIAKREGIIFLDGRLNAKPVAEVKAPPDYPMVYAQVCQHSVPHRASPLSAVATPETPVLC